LSRPATGKRSRHDLPRQAAARFTNPLSARLCRTSAATYSRPIRFQGYTLVPPIDLLESHNTTVPCSRWHEQDAATTYASFSFCLRSSRLASHTPTIRCLFFMGGIRACFKLHSLCRNPRCISHRPRLRTRKPVSTSQRLAYILRSAYSKQILYVVPTATLQPHLRTYRVLFLEFDHTLPPHLQQRCTAGETQLRQPTSRL
jgi:hypothetical protein